MGHSLKNFQHFCIVLGYVRKDATALGLEPYTKLLQRCLVGGLPLAALELIPVGHGVLNIFRIEGWILGIQIQRIPVIGVTPLKKHRQRKMNLMSNIIKRNVCPAVCVACFK